MGAQSGEMRKRKKTRGGASYEVVHTWSYTDADFLTQMRLFPVAEAASGKELKYLVLEFAASMIPASADPRTKLFRYT